ncbi:phosphoribosylanthranilate isomerase [Desulforamulus aquiferis]|uniref:N-(5'-phosphoribosyl)anthranilate isomerase n=1 Tax=Desulforamulus aquiferis TaxID=1397668 RepID=A0AAW7ZFJ2_9FIRM|nr:phosphoribosylanthranilate isomerase [Desulforamulus aquiferis]MDO7788498.1 phosphoribosylanthranilate isomerase [Desulforamulus aquiferis]RYD01907.1 hypothetical protein N752_27670 [Desulforamulus aquiferis]
MARQAVRVKVCGIRDAYTATAAAKAGADAVGMVFVPGRRQVSPELAREICQSLPPFITRVGVFRDASPEEIRHIAKYCGLDLVQLHGQESPDYCRDLGLNSIKAIPVSDQGIMVKAHDYPVKALLFDTCTGGQSGGTGRVFNWQLIQEIKYKLPFILAGGLTPENVGRAVVLLNPYGVDVSSGVERNGQKDPDLIKEFINRVREVGSNAAR